MQLFHSFNHFIKGHTHPWRTLLSGMFSTLFVSGLQPEHRGEGVTKFDHFALAVMGNAQDIWQADPERDAWLINRVAELSVRAGITPPPKLLIYESDNINAGSIINGSMAVSTALLRKLPTDEIDAVIGHELSHHKRRNTNIALGVLTLGIWATATLWQFARSANYKKARSFWNDGKKLRSAWSHVWRTALTPFNPKLWGVSFMSGFLPSFPLAAYSRRNELIADREAAQLIDDPGAMVRALERLEYEHKALPSIIIAEQHVRQPLIQKPDDKPETLDDYKESGKSFLQEVKSAVKTARRDHPPLKERIARLRTMEKGYKRREQRQYQQPEEPTYWQDQSPQRQPERPYRREAQRNDYDSTAHNHPYPTRA